MTEQSDKFEKTLEELESIVESLESEELQLDEALQLFEEGIQRLRIAAEKLDSAHGRVEELIQDVNGEAQVVGLDLSETDDGERDEV